MVRRGEDILLLKRSDRVSAYRGRWHIIGGYLDEPGRTPAEKALSELEEETGVSRAEVARVRASEPFEAFDPDCAKLWQIHPVLVDLRGDPLIHLNWEHTSHRWVSPAEIVQYHPLPTVPEVLRRLRVDSKEGG